MRWRIRVGLAVSSNQAAGLPLKQTRKRWMAAAAVLAVTTGVALWAPWRATQPVDRPLVRLDVDLGADVSLPAPTTEEAVSSSLPMGRGWPTSPARQRSCSPGGWINRKPPSSPGTEGARGAVLLAGRAVDRIRRARAG